MRKLLCLTPLVLLPLLMAAHAPSMAAQPKTMAPPAPTFTTRIEFTTDGDGLVASAKLVGTPKDEVTAKVQQAVLNKAQDWRFEPFQWQGKPAGSTFTRYIDVQAVPTTSGGFALQVRGIDKNKFPSMDYVPKEKGITYRGKHGQYLMLFRVATDPQGYPVKVDRVSPDNRFPAGMDALVNRKQATLKGWRQVPAIVDGTAVACSRVYVMQTLPDKTGPHLSNDEQGWYNDIDMSKLLPKETAMAQAAMAATPDACPPPRLATKIEDTLL